MKKSDAGKKPHDPQKCLSCRMGMLLQEFYPIGVTADDLDEDVLPSIAHLAGFTLVTCSPKKVRKFFKAVLFARNAMRERMVGEQLAGMLESVGERKH